MRGILRFTTTGGAAGNAAPEGGREESGAGEEPANGA